MAALFVVPAQAAAKCNTRACLKRVEWKRYKAHPMPHCTWGKESGLRARDNPEFSGPRYHAKNPKSTASGKFQILTTTWKAFGGSVYAKTAAKATPLEQERVARRVLKGQGIHAWVNC